MLKQLFSQSKLIFWDFDGVIKESIAVKTQAFVELFQPFGSAVANKVRDHHEMHGGMSRFDKLPLYLQWAGEEPSQSRINDFCNQFGRLVLQGVIDAQWVPGVESYLRLNFRRKEFVVVSATPQNELEQILNALDLTECFADVCGAPIPKKDAIRMILDTRKISPNECLMIGDARTDLDAAKANHVPFLLRQHETNSKVFADYSGVSVKDFASL